MPSANSRELILDELQRELLGPKEGPDESFNELPTQRYIVGVLYPRDSQPTGEEAADVDSEGESDGDAEIKTVRANPSRLKRPSTMGISFLVDSSAQRVKIRVSWATFSQKERRGAFNRSERSKELELDVSEVGTESSSPLYDKGAEDAKEFVVQSTIYKGPGSARHVTVFLVNAEETPKPDPRTGYPDKAVLAQHCIYSPRIGIYSPTREIIAKSIDMPGADDPDLRTLRLLYRNRFEFGQGHGCSVTWEDAKGGRCGLLQSTFLPRFAQPSLVVDIEGAPVLKMFDLFQSVDKRNPLQLMTTLVDRYETWISTTFNQKTRESLDSDLRQVFDEHSTRCKQAVARMRSGINLLSKDPLAFEAFCFMNKAMFLQKAYADAAYGARTNGDFKEPDVTDATVREKHRWRAFQIAFILMCLQGLADPTHSDRKFADLMWVPTGAGKTEAYLGLAVFSMVYRRLARSPKDKYTYGGTTVLLRYTLRLLTIQQFQRAAALMCACEKIRLGRPDRYGTEPFLVGLYIGRATTPNWLGESQDYENFQKNPAKHYDVKDNAWFALEFWRREHSKPSGSNPFQLTNCPWCGFELGVSSYDIVDAPGGRRLEVHCRRRGCFFNREAAIPVATVDEEIYARLPSLLISTVDKFAILPFRPRVAALFGHVASFCPTHGFISVDLSHPGSHRLKSGEVITVRRLPEGLPPPDLVIQDELHLINGPLGSLVGMYESTIRLLCNRGGSNHEKSAKVIASTATVRRAADQVWNLFGKEVRPFPPPGLDFEDSFFIREKLPPDAKLFVGLFPSGTALTTAFIKTMVSVMNSGARFKAGGKPAKEWDDFWTLVAYFNSIRELGGTKTRIEDDIQRRVGSTRGDLHIQELTSRIDSKELPEILSKLTIAGGTKGAVDVLACSNMFSVGVDVQRLGIMVMNGQPKSSAEYIQSTGRVGRRNTGLVLVLFNWARARDQSHFERFFDYHNRIHSHVESLTVTPFSEGVRSRALHAQYVAMARVMVPNLARNVQAGNFTTAARTGAQGREFAAWLVRRGGEAGEDESLVRQEIDEFLDRWILDSDATLSYSHESEWDRGHRKYLLRTIDDDVTGLPAGPQVMTPTSMRNIERVVRTGMLRLNRVRRKKG